LLKPAAGSGVTPQRPEFVFRFLGHARVLMEPYSTPNHPAPHRKPPHDGSDLVGATSGEAHSGQTNLEPRVKPNGSPRTSQASVSAALAAANAGLHNAGAFPMRFPGDDGGHSLAEVAQRDLDAALQLLADRAQYITGAGGAAIALRRNGMNDLLCRASAGSNAPELGALLSTEFGLSGESVRTRRALRCDDAERDARVNREVCRELGIASVVVMPVVDDDQVLGVFELFSGKANAFGERDLSALQRLSEMVETAVKLARAAETVTEHGVQKQGVQKQNEQQPKVAEQSAAAVLVAEAAETVEVPIEIEEPNSGVETVSQGNASPAIKPAETATPVASVPPAAPAPTPTPTAKSVAPAKTATVSKPLFWSVALSASSEAAKATDADSHNKEDQSHVPPMLRNLRKCEACGFPVSTGRTLCVECEEKKWRGQLKPQTPAAKQEVVRQAATTTPESRGEQSGDVQSNAVTKSAATKVDAAKVIEAPAPTIAPAIDMPSASESPASANPPTPDFAFSVGREPSQSWLSANKYILGVILVAAVAIAAFVFLR
jgi:GAF domain-containing protein